jgi:hypothetical protein
MTTMMMAGTMMTVMTTTDRVSDSRPRSNQYTATVAADRGSVLRFGELTPAKVAAVASVSALAGACLLVRRHFVGL